MFISDYDDVVHEKDIENSRTTFNEQYHSNLQSSFQEKNENSVHLKPKLDYNKIMHDNHTRKQQRLYDLRTRHQQKRTALEARFDLLRHLSY